MFSPLFLIKNSLLFCVCFVSKGTGDLNIKIECMNLVKTYEVADCRRFIATEYTDADRILVQDDYLDNFIVECDYKVITNSSNSWGSLLITNGTRTSTSGISGDTHPRIDFSPKSQNISLSGGTNTLPFTLNQYYHVKIIKTGANNVKIYIDDTLLEEVNLTTKSYSTFKLMKVWYGTGSANIYMGIKNIQIKPL